MPRGRGRAVVQGLALQSAIFTSGAPFALSLSGNGQSSQCELDIRNGDSLGSLHASEVRAEEQSGPSSYSAQRLDRVKGSPVLAHHGWTSGP